MVVTLILTIAIIWILLTAFAVSAAIETIIGALVAVVILIITRKKRND